MVPGSMEGLLQWWVGWKFRKKEGRVWRVLPAAVIWSIWKCRNDCLFFGIQPNLVELSDLIKVRVALW